MNFNELTSMIPAEITIVTMIKFIAVLAVFVFVVCFLFRMLFGKKSAVNEALCAGIGVLCIYITTIMIYTFSPGNLENFLVPLPFLEFSGDSLYLMSFEDAGFTAICSQFLSMVILVLLYNLASGILPDGEETSVVNWLLLRFMTIIAAMTAHWFLSGVTESFLPDLLISYGPMILLLCLVASMMMGILKVILGIALTVVNPLFGILFTFFFRNTLGKQISKAMLTATILSLLVVILRRLGYGIVCISASALASYIPLLAVLLGLWVLIGRKL